MPASAPSSTVTQATPGWAGAQVQHVGPRGAQPRDEGALQQVAGDAGILADGDQGLLPRLFSLGQHLRRRQAHLISQVRIQTGVDHAPGCRQFRIVYPYMITSFFRIDQSFPSMPAPQEHTAYKHCQLHPCHRNTPHPGLLCAPPQGRQHSQQAQRKHDSPCPRPELPAHPVGKVPGLLIFHGSCGAVTVEGVDALGRLCQKTPAKNSITSGISRDEAVQKSQKPMVLSLSDLEAQLVQSAAARAPGHRQPQVLIGLGSDAAALGVLVRKPSCIR